LLGDKLACGENIRLRSSERVFRRWPRNEARPILASLDYQLFSGHMPTITMVTILNVYFHSTFAFSSYRFFMTTSISLIHRISDIDVVIKKRQDSVCSSCRLRRLAVFGHFLSSRLNRTFVSPVLPDTCRTEQVPNRIYISSQLSRFKVDQRIRL